MPCPGTPSTADRPLTRLGNQSVLTPPHSGVLGQARTSLMRASMLSEGSLKNDIQRHPKFVVGHSRDQVGLIDELSAAVDHRRPGSFEVVNLEVEDGSPSVEFRPFRHAQHQSDASTVEERHCPGAEQELHA